MKYIEGRHGLKHRIQSAFRQKIAALYTIIITTIFIKSENEIWEIITMEQYFYKNSLKLYKHFWTFRIWTKWATYALRPNSYLYLIYFFRDNNFTENFVKLISRKKSNSTKLKDFIRYIPYIVHFSSPEIVQNFGWCLNIFRKFRSHFYLDCWIR